MAVAVRFDGLLDDGIAKDYDGYQVRWALDAEFERLFTFQALY